MYEKIKEINEIFYEMTKQKGEDKSIQAINKFTDELLEMIKDESDTKLMISFLLQRIYSNNMNID